jgi:hypothetical protein
MGDAVMATIRTVELITHEHAYEQPRQTALDASLGDNAPGLGRHDTGRRRT